MSASIMICADGPFNKRLASRCYFHFAWPCDAAYASSHCHISRGRMISVMRVVRRPPNRASRRGARILLGALAWLRCGGGGNQQTGRVDIVQMRATPCCRMPSADVGTSCDWLGSPASCAHDGDVA